MDNMLEENKNLKDSSSPTLPKGKGGESNEVFLPLSLGEGLGVRPMSYTKTNKLITALYMVTDIMEKEEPLRNKLRNLGADIISDIYSLPEYMDKKINAIISFLDIALAINLISEMNCNILKKEFLQLKQSLQENSRQDLTLSEFFTEQTPLLEEEGAGGGNSLITTSLRPKSEHSSSIRRRENSIGHNGQTGFDTFKKQRRESIFKIIKGGNEMSIKDIDLALQGLGEKCGEKTLQRELVSMVGDGVLKKSGEKRWSRYFLANA